MQSYIFTPSITPPLFPTSNPARSPKPSPHRTPSHRVWHRQIHEFTNANSMENLRSLRTVGLKQNWAMFVGRGLCDANKIWAKPKLSPTQSPNSAQSALPSAPPRIVRSHTGGICLWRVEVYGFELLVDDVCVLLTCLSRVNVLMFPQDAIKIYVGNSY